MKHFFKISFAILILVGIISLLCPLAADAYQIKNPLSGLIGSTVEEESIPVIIGSAIKLFLSIIGAVALILFIYGGFVWLTSQGNQNSIDTGKKILTWTIIGLILVLMSYIIIDFTIYALVGESVPITYTPPTPKPALPTPQPVVPKCSNGIDDDGDGLIDFGSDYTKNDPGCESAEDDNETGDKCFEFSKKQPDYCSRAGLQCVPCSIPNADGEDFNCRQKAAGHAETVLGAKQATCSGCVGTTVGCTVGEACCCLDCAVDKIQNKNCAQIIIETGSTPPLSCTSP